MNVLMMRRQRTWTVVKYVQTKKIYPSTLPFLALTVSFFFSHPPGELGIVGESPPFLPTLSIANDDRMGSRISSSGDDASTVELEDVSWRWCWRLPRLEEVMVFVEPSFPWEEMVRSESPRSWKEDRGWEWEEVTVLSLSW
jgi:hypothetical protein